MKKIMLSTISFMVIIFNLFCICVNAYNNTEYFASYITIDNAPIVFVEDESQLPQSMFSIIY